MELILKRPLAFFDIESTGLDTATDKIVSISILKVMPDYSTIKKTALLNPKKPIDPKATEVHGITNEMVADKPSFSQVSKSLHEFISECDLAGYNSNNFDIPLLCEEFLRCEIDFPTKDTKFIDVGNIFKKKEERTLSAAVKFYCNREMENAHDAEADIQATYDVFLGQFNKYPDIPKTVEELAEFSSFEKRVDFAGKIALDEDGDYIYNFGKSKGVKIKKDPSFAYWMLGKDFTRNTLKCVREILDEVTV